VPDNGRTDRPDVFIEEWDLIQADHCVERITGSGTTPFAPTTTASGPTKTACFTARPATDALLISEDELRG
jgi:hypothetical protein